MTATTCIRLLLVLLLLMRLENTILPHLHIDPFSGLSKAHKQFVKIQLDLCKPSINLIILFLPSLVCG